MISMRKRNKIMKLICNFFSKNKHLKYLDPNYFKLKTKYSQDEIEEILLNLSAHGYISYQKFERQTRPFVRLENPGRIYFDLKSNMRMKLIIVPIAVSVITNGILKLLELIFQWLL